MNASPKFVVQVSRRMNCHLTQQAHAEPHNVSSTLSQTVVVDSTNPVAAIRTSPVLFFDIVWYCDRFDRCLI